MTKREKIQEAYGKHWEGSKRYVDLNNGTISNRDRNFDIHNGFFEQVKVNGENKFRPKSLQGIENNNGWIKIESESDLPKKDEWYWVKKKTGEQIMSGYQRIISNERWISEITHYQPIIKPELPIY